MTQTHDSDAIAAEILRLDGRGSYTEDDHHRLQELAPALARAWLARRVEYRHGLPPVAAIEAQGARGGWWQYKRPDHSPPQLIELRVRRPPFLTDGAAPEILGNRFQCQEGGFKDWRRVEGTGWRTEKNPFKKADLRAADPSEWSWRPCTADADPLPWEPGQEGGSGADLVAEVQRLRAENAKLRDQLEAERLDALEAGERVP